VIRSRAAAAVVVSLVAVLPSAGCYQGFDDTVNSQGPTGNGTDFPIGADVLVQDATLVTGPEGASDVASLVLSIINNGEVPDALVTVSTEPSTTSSQRAPIAVQPGTSVQVGGPAGDQIVLTGLQVTPGSYATVTLSFERGGSETRNIAVVPAVGYYEGYGPAPTAPK
jgi:hypothetical protein